jgi:hypothetical protein
VVYCFLTLVCWLLTVIQAGKEIDILVTVVPDVRNFTAPLGLAPIADRRLYAGRNIVD